MYSSGICTSPPRVVVLFGQLHLLRREEASKPIVETGKTIKLVKTETVPSLNESTNWEEYVAIASEGPPCKDRIFDLADPFNFM